jgi:RNA 3'-terminal phosphate cyclase-like protein
MDMGKIKRVRGSVVSLRIPPTSAARVAHATKGMLHRLLPDVWIHTDVHTSRGNKQGSLSAGPNPALSICLAAESTTGVILAAETCLDARKQRLSRTSQDGESVFASDSDKTPKHDSHGITLPEDLGIQGAAMLLEEVRRGGCIDTGAQSIVFLLMCVSPEDISRVRIGKLSSYSISSLRLFKAAFDVEFKVRTDEESMTVLMSCLGSGYRNMARAST